MADLKVKIDAGHTKGYNKGTCPDYYEGTQMHKLSVYELNEFAKYEGVAASISRGLNDFPSIYDRVKMAQNYDLLISNHTNAPRTDTDKAIIIEPLSKTNQMLSIKLGQTIADTMGIGFSLWSRANKSGTDYYGIHRYGIKLGIKMPLIIEHGYHTNSKHCAWLMIDDNLRILARNKVRCIAEHYGLKLKAGHADPIIFYKIGDKGDAVLRLQGDLVRLGYPLDTDGSFGPDTESKVKQYQRDNKLTVDGIAGPQTLSKIEEQIKALDAKADDPDTIAPDGKYYKVISQFVAVKSRKSAEDAAKKIEQILKDQDVNVDGIDPWTKIVLE